MIVKREPEKTTTKEKIVVKTPNKDKPTQCKIIMDYLRKNRYINQKIATKLKIYRLGARIADLKASGVEFISYFPDDPDAKDSRFKRYELLNDGRGYRREE